MGILPLCYLTLKVEGLICAKPKLSPFLDESTDLYLRKEKDINLDERSLQISAYCKHMSVTDQSIYLDGNYTRSCTRPSDVDRYLDIDMLIPVNLPRHVALHQVDLLTLWLVGKASTASYILRQIHLWRCDRPLALCHLLAT